jgi:SNF2 family DNA or RNA helicase
VLWKPHDYQRRASAFAVRAKRVALHLDIGCGKSSTTLHTICELLDCFDTRGVMVFGPLRVVTIAWPEEIRKWDFPLKVQVVRGTAIQRQQQLRNQADVYLLNYELLPWWCEFVLAETKAKRQLRQDMLVLDESSCLKASNSARFKALKPIVDSQLFPRIIELTGTPAPEDYMDLFAQYRLLDRGEALTPYVTHFRNRYYDQNPYSEFDWKLKDGAAEAIEERIAPLTFTARAADYLELPDLLENTIYVDLPPSARHHYASFEKDMLAVVQDTTVAAPSAAIVSEKCRQVCSGGVYDAEGQVLRLHASKFDALDEILESLPSTACVLVAYWYRHEADTIHTRYATAPILGPGCTEKDALHIVRDWNARKHRLVFIHPASVGHGINLQAGGSHLVWLTIPWSNQTYRQTVGRLHRQGQKERVTVHRILCRDTVEELVERGIVDKEFTQQALRKALVNLHNPL